MKRVGEITYIGVVAIVSAFGLVRCRGDHGEPAATTPAIPATTVALQPNAIVDFVIDGDTVDLFIGDVQERVRLIGVDTPETKKANTPVECFGPEASAFTASLLPPGTPVYLERDVEARDDYGRLLGYVFRTSDGQFVNRELIAQGFATLLMFPPNVTYADEMREAARVAERRNVGLWAACPG